MQKHLKVCTFASAYEGFKNTHNLTDNVVGNLQDFKEYMLENGLKIDEKDMLKELYIVGKEVQNKEKKRDARKNKVKKIDHCTYQGSDDKVYIRLSDDTMREAPPECNRETIKQQKMKNRFFSIGAIIVLLLMGGWNELRGDENLDTTIYETSIPIYCDGNIILDYVESQKVVAARKQVEYLQKILKIRKKYPKKEDIIRIEKMMDKYFHQIYDRKYLCVP